MTDLAGDTPLPIRSFYFFNTPHTEAVGIQVWGTGFLEKTRQHPTHNRILDCYCLGYLLEGEGDYESDETGKRPLQAGDVFLVFPGIRHSYGPRGRNDSWLEYWFLFDGPTIRSLHREEILDPANPVISVGASSRLVELFEETLALSADGETEELSRIPEKLFLVLSETLRRRKATHAAKTGDVGKIIEMLRDQPQRNWNFQELARSIGFSYSHFRRRFHEVSGEAPHRFLVSQRMKLACRLLAQDKPVKEVAWEIGMDDPQYFSRLFRQNLGKSPKAFARDITHQ